MTQYFEIRIKGHLDKSWADWFDGMRIDHQASGDTLLSGSLPDQAALHAVLNRLRDLGVQLISVNPVDLGQAPGDESADETSS
jgi:hypothetical protein